MTDDNSKLEVDDEYMHVLETIDIEVIEDTDVQQRDLQNHENDPVAVLGLQLLLTEVYEYAKTHETDAEWDVEQHREKLLSMGISPERADRVLHQLVVAPSEK